MLLLSIIAHRIDLLFLQCKLKKALYGLKQAPRAWYARLDLYLQTQGFKRGSTDSNLYCKIVDDILIIVEVYADDIIFGIDDEKLSEDFAKRMQQEFEISLLGEMNFLSDRIALDIQG